MFALCDGHKDAMIHMDGVLILYGMTDNALLCMNSYLLNGNDSIFRYQFPLVTISVINQYNV